MFQKKLDTVEGLLLVQSKDSRLDSAIHMLFMLMDLTAVWINSEMSVVDVRQARRWRLAYIPKAPARYVLEVPAKAGIQFSIGDKVEIE